MIRGLHLGGMTIIVFLTLWAVVFVLIRFISPHVSKMQFKVLAVSFGIAFAAFLCILLALLEAQAKKQMADALMVAAQNKSANVGRSESVQRSR